MMMKTIKRLVLLTFAVVLCLSSCSKYKQIEIESAKMESVRMSGMRGVSADVVIVISNPAGKVKLSNLSADVFQSGKIIGKVAVDPFSIKARSTEEYTLEAELVLDKGISAFEILGMIKNVSKDSITFDITADVKVGGFTRHLKFDGIPMSHIMKSIRK
ncbi:MAG: LEA type 2 family protein [Bacteroidales bacterium]|nr:LEA type 2 family protein [Bacteroidales bacterium]